MSVEAPLMPQENATCLYVDNQWVATGFSDNGTVVVNEDGTVTAYGITVTLRNFARMSKTKDVRLSTLIPDLSKVMLHLGGVWLRN